jgi:hypothetical protein
MCLKLRHRRDLLTGFEICWPEMAQTMGLIAAPEALGIIHLGGRGSVGSRVE